MEKYFNTTGLCIPSEHYMVHIQNKLIEIKKLIDRGKYFVINSPGQYGKSTTLYQLSQVLHKEYIVILIRFEGVGEKGFRDEKSFSNKFLKLMMKSLRTSDKYEYELLQSLYKEVEDLGELSDMLAEFIMKATKPVVLLIDEVRNYANAPLFLCFLSMLREKYLATQIGGDYTFQSIILTEMNNSKGEKIYSHPWNITVNFKIELGFNEVEIESILEEYSFRYKLDMDTGELAKRIYWFTSGYPYLVSRVCQIIDEEFYPLQKLSWSLRDIDKAIKQMTLEINSFTENIISILRNNIDLYELVKSILINGEFIIFNPLEPIIKLGVDDGILRERDMGITLSNKVFEEISYNYILSRSRRMLRDMSKYNIKSNFITKGGGLNIEKILNSFSKFMQEQYGYDEDMEQDGKLIFLAFMKPIIRGEGYAFKEIQISDEKRLDMIITYNQYQYVIELKKWHGKKYHEVGLDEFNSYLKKQKLSKGYLIVFNASKNKEYKQERIISAEQEILMFYV